jgi:nucleotide-binding universal stress UspA family protein
MYKRIAVAVDGSDVSVIALNEALKLAKLMEATLLLIHVCEEVPVLWNIEGSVMLPVADLDKIFIEAGNQLLNKDLLRANEFGVTVETKLIEDYSGRIGAVISQTADQWQAELLVLGTHGRKGFDHLFMGSVAEGVMRTARVPLLLVHGK